MKLLQELAKRMEYHLDHDHRLFLKDYDARITMAEGPQPRFHAKSGGEAVTTAYDLNCLLRQGLAYVAYAHDFRTGSEPANWIPPVVFGVTDSGMETVRELEKPWLTKAIEKQPMTFVQIVFAGLNVVYTLALIFWTWWLASGHVINWPW